MEPATPQTRLRDLHFRDLGITRRVGALGVFLALILLCLGALGALGLGDAAERMAQAEELLAIGEADAAREILAPARRQARKASGLLWLIGGSFALGAALGGLLFARALGRELSRRQAAATAAAPTPPVA